MFIEPIVAVCVCLSLAVIYLVRQAFQRRKHNFPPGPRGVPFLGCIPMVDRIYIYDSMSEISESYGDIFTLQLGLSKVVVLNGHRAIKAAFNKLELCGRPQGFPFDHMPQGNYGIIASYNQTWADVKKFTLRNLRDHGVGKPIMEYHIMQEVKISLEEFSHAAETGESTDLAESLNVAIISALWNVVAGKAVRRDDKLINKLGAALQLTTSIFMFWAAAALFFPFLMIIPKRFLLSSFYCTTINALRDMSDGLVKEHKDTLHENDPKDFIDSYLCEMRRLEREGVESTFSERSLSQVISDLFLAGIETTPSTVRWGIMLLSYYPDVQEKMHAEIVEAVGIKKELEYVDRVKLPYTEAVIAEIQRIASVAPIGVIHAATVDTELLGYRIEKGTIVISNIYGCHRDPKVWKNPWKFNPENFLNSDGKFVTREGFLPFSTGRRNCIGEIIARTGLFLFIASYVQNYKFTLDRSTSSFSDEEINSGEALKFRSPKKTAGMRGCPYYKVFVSKRL